MTSTDVRGDRDGTTSVTRLVVIVRGLPSLADRFDARSNSIGFLRLMLALCVLVAHCWPLGKGAPTLLYTQTGRQADLGSLAVDAFFVLSGFLVTASALRFGVVRYLWHRALRILPGYWVCLVVTAFVFAPIVALGENGTLSGFWSHSQGPVDYVRGNWFMALDQWTISGLLRTVPYGRFIRGGGAFDGSLWTLRYEVLCYLLVAVLAATAVLARAARAVIALLLFTYAIMLADFIRVGSLLAKPRHHSVLGPYPLVGVFDEQLVIYLAFLFLLGATARLYADRVPLHPALASVAAIALVVSLWRGGFYLIGQPAEAYLLLYAVVALPRRLCAVGRRSDYSYGIYIYAFPVQQLIALLVGTRYGMAGYMALSFVGTFILAALSWHVIEHPALTLKNWTPRLRRNAPRGNLPQVLASGTPNAGSGQPAASSLASLPSS